MGGFRVLRVVPLGMLPLILTVVKGFVGLGSEGWVLRVSGGQWLGWVFLRGFLGLVELVDEEGASWEGPHREVQQRDRKAHKP